MASEVRLTTADREHFEWQELWRIHVELGGPKPPTDVLARHLGDRPEEAATQAAETLRAQRASERAIVARRLLLAAVALGRVDVAGKLRGIIRGLGLQAKRGARRGPRFRVWRSPTSGEAA